MEQNITPVKSGNVRKRKSQPQQWKRNIEKRQRYSAKGLPVHPTCGHRVGYQCMLLTTRDIKDYHEAFYSTPEKSKQGTFILKYCRAEIPNPKRKKKDPVKSKSATFQYSIVNQAGNNLRVCRSTFLNILAPLTKHGIIGVFKRFKNGKSHVPVETRGGNHKEAKFGLKRDAVKNFICTLKASESHYSLSTIRTEHT
ncbi:hypothetical protein ANN_22351 [Periplaneta americana]|uniref:Uncharacterized protein n=1 Tax=Periplaneta americana TaxID=6978 RepID=A0ABQ8S8D1_PERAM|nr:hypothetical protein ANN_22351 [Periplaneta americana]